MTNIYSRLFHYRERAGRKPLEDFLTEALADLFGRLDEANRRALLTTLLPRGCVERIADLAELELETQVAIGSLPGAGRKRPDMVLTKRGSPLAVIEVKVGAGYQQHVFEHPEDEDEKIVSNQLDTYATWIGRREGRPVGWPGAIVLLTAWRDPPEGFGAGRNDGVLQHATRWKAVGEVLHTIAADGRGDAQGALAEDLHAFLEENALMTKYPTSRDLAATMMFARSFGAVDAMIDDTIKAIAHHVPKLSAGRRVRTDFLKGSNVYWGWFPFARALRRRPTLPYLAFGVCFELPDHWQCDQMDAMAHEPFAFVACGDDKRRERVDTILEKAPDGWFPVEDRWLVISPHPITGFPTHPDARVDAMQEWAKRCLDRLVLCVPRYEEAPAGPTITESDPDDV